MMLYTAASPTTALESSPPSTIVIAPPPFTVTPIMYSVATSAPTLIEFKFNAPIAMAKGNRNLANYYDEFTKIVLKFQMYDTMNLFDYDLGYTSVTPVTSKIIPCWNNDDLVVYGSGLKCELFVGKSSGTLTSGDFANLVVTNYKILNKNDRVSISVMAKNVPGANPGKVTVQLINILTNEEFTIGQLAVVLPAVSSAAGAAATTCTVTASVLEVQASTDLTFTFGNLAAAAMTTNPAIMIEIPVNWQFSTSIFTPTQVFFNGNELFTGKFYYNSYNRILFITPKDDVLAGTATIVLKGIKAPEGESLTNTFKLTYFISGVRQITGTAVATPANLPIPSFTIPTVKVTTDIPYYGAKGASYYFEWTSLKYYTNPIIEITLPNPGANEYNFVVGGPYVCTLYINGTYMRSDISPFKQTCSFPAASSVFSMTFFKDIYAGSTIKIGIRYIDHFTASFSAPASVVVKTVTYDTYVGTTTAVVSKNTNVVFGNDPTVFLGPFTKANIAVTNVWAFPNSAKAKSLIYVDFTINSFLPKGTKIQVYFPPTDFTVVAYSITPYCFLKGDNKLIKSCTTYSDVTMKKVIMEIADDFVAGKAITFAFFGHSTYEINSITYDDVTTNTITPFYVDATYNTQILAETPAASYYNWRIYPEYPVWDSANLGPDPVASVIVDPINEAERALYNFTVDMTSVITDIYDTDKIWIRFPSFYDPYLSIYPLFVTSPQLKGALNIEIWNKDVIIWGFYTMKLRTNITLSIWGVINPNKIPDVNITGFQMGLLTSANRTRFMTGLFGNFVLDPAPDIIEILSLANKIPYARYDDNYTMEINSHIPIKDSSQGGQLKVMFPDDFYMDVFNGVCATEDRYSLYSVCSQFYNTYLFNSANKLFDFKTKGSLTVKINNHRNAEYDGLTGSVIVYNYDKSTRQVLSRSYGTLSKSYLNFTYDGLQLFANNGQPYTLEVGSLSDPIPIGAVEAMKQRLTVVPLYFDSNFVFANVPVTLVPGSTGSFIRIAAPQTMLRKKFYITFSKSGDIISKFYAPIPKFPVIITKGSLMRNVIPYNTLYVNRGGISIPLYVDINNPPYDNVAVTLTITNPSASLITMNTTSLVFGKSSSRLYYLITGVSDTFTDSAINMQFTLSGTDASSFQVTTPLVSIPVNPPDPDPAPFIEYRIDQNNRGNINIYVKSSKLAYVYCAAGYQYMPEPTYEMVKGKNLTANIYGYSKPLYAEGYLDTTNFEGIIQMTGLTPSVQYTLYCYTMNLNGVPSATYNKLNFQNTPAQRIATFTMKVNQGIVSQELRDEYVKRLATLMDIQSSRVFEKLFCKSEPPIGSEPDTTYITYYVMPDPLNNDDDISPINMVRGLNKRRSDITKFVPKLDPGNLLVMKELKENPPTFKSRPTMDRRGTSWITINATVSSCGYLMVAAQPINGTRWLLSTNATLFFFENQVIKNLYPKEKEFYPYGIENALGETNIFSLYGGPNYKPTTGTRRMLKVIEYTPLTLQERYPTAFQMNRSLNQTNLPEKHSYSIEVDDTTKTWTVNATGLRDNIIHNIYVSAVSDKPIYPDYMDPDYVAQVNLKTVKLRRLLNIYSIYSAKVLLMNLLLLAIPFLAPLL